MAKKAPKQDKEHEWIATNTDNQKKSSMTKLEAIAHQMIEQNKSLQHMVDVFRATRLDTFGYTTAEQSEAESVSIESGSIEPEKGAAGTVGVVRSHVEGYQEILNQLAVELAHLKDSV